MQITEEIFNWINKWEHIVDVVIRTEKVSETEAWAVPEKNRFGGKKRVRIY